MKIGLILIICGVSLFGAAINHREQKLNNIHIKNLHHNLHQNKNASEIRKLQNRISWLTALQNHVSYKKNNTRFFPYDMKLKALQARLAKLENAL